MGIYHKNMLEKAIYFQKKNEQAFPKTNE